MSSIASEIWSIFILLIVIVVLLMLIQVALKVTDIKGQRSKEQSEVVKITLELDGAPITVEASNQDRVEEILRLVQDIQARQSLSVREGARATEYPTGLS